MKFCSECGSPVRRQWIEKDGRDRNVCTSCGTTHYDNPRVIVCGIISWQDRLLMCRRAQDPARGQWTVPLGFLERGETLEEGVARETFEETGIIINPAARGLCSI